jgi:competence protein ComEC
MTWRRAQRITIAICVGLLVSAAHAYHYKHSRLPSSCFDHPIQASGTVVSFVEQYQGAGDVPYLTFDLVIRRLSADDCGVGNTVRAFVSTSPGTPMFKLGDSITVKLRLRPVASLWNRAQLPRNILSVARGIDATASISAVQQIEHDAMTLNTIRHNLSELLTEHSGAGDAERVLQGLLLGRKSAMTQDDWALLRGTGIVHVFIVSGVHVSLFALWAQWLFSLPRRLALYPRDSGPSVFHALAVCALTGGYVLLTGASLPAQRAFIMMGFATLMRVTLWPINPLSAVVLAAAILITFNPFSALTPGFWLSVVLTGVILVETDRVAMTKIGSWFRLTSIMTLVSSLLGIVFFNQFSLIALLGNLLIAPIFTLVVLPAGLLGMVLGGVFGERAGWVIGGVADLVSKVLSIVKEVIPQNVEDILLFVYVHPGIWVLVALIGAASLVRSARVVVAILVVPVCLVGSTHFNPATEVVITDVGQGTMGVLFHGDFTLVYDTGPAYGSGASAAEREVIPWLKARGVRRIDLLVVSHSDLDHSGGLTALRQHFEIERHWGFGGERCVAGRSLRVTHSLFARVMMGTGQSTTAPNADSCVLLVEADGATILFPGDIPARAELHLIASGSLPAQIDILVAPHHGSDTSSSQTFIDRVNPEHTVFTTKRANRFNHPSPLGFRTIPGEWRRAVGYGPSWCG